MSSDFYKYEIYSKTLKLTKYLQVLKSRHYSNNAPIYFAQDLQKILDVIRNNLDNVLEVHLQELNNFLDTSFLSLCSIIEKSSPSYVPWSLIPELEELTSNLISHKEMVLIRSENFFNYSIHITDVMSEYLATIRTFIGDIEDLKEDKYNKPRIFTIPLLEKNNALLHSILFHELGHYYEKDFSNSSETQRFINETIAQTIKEDDEITEKTLFTSAQAIVMLKGFIREIYSDIFALYCCGIPILFCTYHFLKAYPEPSLPSKKNNFYPPLKFRLRLLYSICKNEGTIEKVTSSKGKAYEVLTEALINIEKALDNKNDIDILNTTPASLIASKAIEKIKDKITSDISNKISPNHGDFENINKLYDKLLESIPPCELDGHPQKIQKILIAGWAAYFHFNKMENIVERYEKIKTLNLICLKAMTQSFFFRKFLKAKNGDTN